MVVFLLFFASLCLLQVKADAFFNGDDDHDFSEDSLYTPSNDGSIYGEDFDLVAVKYKLICKDKKGKSLPFRFRIWIMEEDTFSDDEIVFHKAKANGLAKNRIHGIQYGDGAWDNYYEYYVKIKSNCKTDKDGTWATYARVLEPTCRVGSRECEYELTIDLKQ